MNFSLPDLSLAGMGPALQVALAMLLGGVVGFERERADKPAGLRTHMLLAGAAAFLVVLGEGVIGRFTDEGMATVVRADPLRIFQAIVTGIGILAAGTIFRRDDHHIEGLTTAASLLFVGSVGIAVASGQLVLAIAATVLALVALRVLRILEKRKPPRHGASSRAGDRDTAPAASERRSRPHRARGAGRE